MPSSLPSSPPTAGCFTYVWTYRVDPQRRREFLAAYGPGGDWVQLFSRDESYLGTTLLQDVNDENRYATLDHWNSRADRDAFRRRYAAEFRALDERCEAWTTEELFVGDFARAGDERES